MDLWRSLFPRGCVSCGGSLRCRFGDAVSCMGLSYQVILAGSCGSACNVSGGCGGDSESKHKRVDDAIMRLVIVG